MQNQEPIYDIVISGLGVYGASTLYHASQAGKKVLGIEQLTVGNDKSSSYGEPRITRQNVFEGFVYPKLAKQSQEIITQIEKRTNQKLQHFNGGLYIGLPQSSIIQNILKNEQLYKTKLEKLNSDQLNQRFPLLNVPEGFQGIIENTAGFVNNDKIVATFVKLALKNKNASVLEHTKLINFYQCENYIELQTNTGKIIRTRKLVMANGIGMVSMLRQFEVPIWIQKNQAVWLNWDSKQTRPDNFPILYWDYYQKKHQIYSFPNIGEGMKMGLHLRGKEYIHEDQVDYEPDQDLVRETQEMTKLAFRNINWDKKNAINFVKTCFYTMTQDGQFIVDFHPQNKNIVLLSCCSGHGFKYAPQIGKDVVKMTETAQAPYDEFLIQRFKHLNQARL